MRFDGVSTGEFGINAAIAGHYGVPVTLVTGDDKAVAQTRAFLGEQVVGVAVKEGISTFAALHLHPTRAIELIRAGAARAVAAADSASPYVLASGATIELDFDHQARADQAVLCPGVERTGERTIVFRPSDGLELCRIFRAVMKLASIRMTP